MVNRNTTKFSVQLPVMSGFIHQLDEGLNSILDLELNSILI